MSLSKQDEMKLRVEEINAKIRDAEAFAEATNQNFYLNTVDKEYYCSAELNDMEYLERDMDGKGAWMTSSDFC